MKKYPEGHFIGMYTGIGIAIFGGLGVPLSIILKNNAFIGVGPALGIPLGAAIGKAVEDKYRKKDLIRPLTKKEKHTKKIEGIIAVGIIGLGVLVFLVLLLSF